MNKVKLRELQLSAGAHQSLEDGMCVMEAVSYLAGEAFSDSPKCSCPVIGSFLRTWNDGLNNKDRQMLKEFVPLLVNSKSTVAVERKRHQMIGNWFYKVWTPSFLDLAGLNKHAKESQRLGEKANWDAAWAAAWAAAKAAAGDAARIAAGDATGIAAWAAAKAAAGIAAREAAGSAAGIAAWDAAREAAWDAAGIAAWDAAKGADWAAAKDAAWAAAKAAADAALRPTVVKVQQSAMQLVRDCLAIKKG